VNDTGPASRITLGFQAAGLVNVAGVLLFSKAFTNDALIARSPVVFSRFGLVCIILWGLAHLAVARRYQQVPLLVAVFAVEKFVYTGTWFSWMHRFGSELPRLFSESPLAAAFYAIYGPIDLLFGIFFAVVAMREMGRNPS
jgi:hypothetical protein